ncbi:MAG: ATP-binding protein, partial [Winogradskyella sp.]
MKNWIPKAISYLDKSLGKVPSELNEIDWKENLSPKNAKLCQHISAFANMPGGGFLVFGVNDKTATIIGIERK